LVLMMLTAPTPASTSEACCEDTCEHANDGDCDDGGEGNEFQSCGLGTDCIDCGDRCGTPLPNTRNLPPASPSPPRMPLPPLPPPPACCNNGCGFADDGWCDDGGPGSDYNECTLGTDCLDCGNRCLPPRAPPPPLICCTNRCEWRVDGTCDDGGSGSDYAECELGTDCTDCSSRCIPPPLPPFRPGERPPAPPPAPLAPSVPPPIPPLQPTACCFISSSRNDLTHTGLPLRGDAVDLGRLLRGWLVQSEHFRPLS